MSYCGDSCIYILIISRYLSISASNELAEVSRPSPKTAYIRYSPSTFQQKMISSKGVSGLFKVQYDVRRSLDAGDIYVGIRYSERRN